RLAPLPGTLVLYFASPDLELLDELDSALRAVQKSALTKLDAKARALVAVKDQPLAGRYVDAVLSAECVFDVQYQGKPLAENLALLYGNRFSTVTLAYL